MARILYTAHTWEAHIRPLKPWIDAQREQGHEVMLAVPEHLVHVAEEYGVPYVQSGSDWVSDPETNARVPLMLVQEGNDAFNRELFTQCFPQTAKGMAEAVVGLAEGGWRPDIIMHDISEDGGRMAAELLGVPSVALDNGLARLKYQLHPEIKPVLDQTRAELGLPPEPEDRPASFEHVLTPAPPSLLLGDLPISTLVGYRHENPVRPGETLPESVEQRGDQRFVYQMLGRSGSDYPEWKPMFAESNASAIEALSDTDGIVALVSVGEGNVAQYADITGPHVEVVERTAQPAALEQADLFIGHAGFGSIREAIEAGVPTLWLPNSTDQPDNAERLQALGLGIRLDRTASPAEIKQTMEYMLEHRDEFAERVAQARDETHALPSLSEITERLDRALQLGDTELRALHEPPADPGTPALGGGPSDGPDDGIDPGSAGAAPTPGPAPVPSEPGAGAAAEIPETPEVLGRDLSVDPTPRPGGGSEPGDSSEPGASDELGDEYSEMVLICGPVNPRAIELPRSMGASPDFIDIMLDSGSDDERGALATLPDLSVTATPLESSPATPAEVFEQPVPEPAIPAQVHDSELGDLS